MEIEVRTVSKITVWETPKTVKVGGASVQLSKLDHEQLAMVIKKHVDNIKEEHDRQLRVQ